MAWTGLYRRQQLGAELLTRAPEVEFGAQLFEEFSRFSLIDIAREFAQHLSLGPAEFHGRLPMTSNVRARPIAEAGEA